MNLKERYNTIANGHNNLENSIIPTQSDLEKFEKWKNKERQGKLIMIIFSIFILIIVGVVVLLIAKEESLQNQIFGVAVYLIFILVIINSIKDYIKSRNWKIEYCNYGTVTNKYRNPGNTRNSSRHANKYHVIVLTNNNKTININTCKFSEYKNLQINDEVIIFAVDDKYLYLLKK